MVVIQYFLHERKVVVFHPRLAVDGFPRRFESFESLVVAVWQLCDFILQANGAVQFPNSFFLTLEFIVSTKVRSSTNNHVV